MSSVDERIVSMTFNNRQFKEGVDSSLKSIDALKKGLDFEGATKGLESIEGASKKIDLSKMASDLDTLTNRFSTMGIVGMSVINTLTNDIINMGKKAVKSVTDPMLEGGKNRTRNIAQAKFQFQALGMDIAKAMENANTAVKGTAFGLDAAAKAASQFGASGMKAGDDMATALRGISGVASMTGSSYEEIANIFTTVSGNGRLMTQQLNQLSGRGLNVAATLADALGTTEEAVRGLVTDGRISFEMFYKAMDGAFGEQATKANDLYVGSLSNVKSALSRIGALFMGPWEEGLRRVFNALMPILDIFQTSLGPAAAIFESIIHEIARDLIILLESIDTRVFIDAGLIVTNVLLAISKIVKAVGRGLTEAFGGSDTTRAIESPLAPLAKLSSFLIPTEGLLTIITTTIKSLGIVIGWTFRIAAQFFNVLGKVGSWVIEKLTFDYQSLYDNMVKSIVAFDKQWKISERLITAYKAVSNTLFTAVECVKDWYNNANLAMNKMKEWIFVALEWAKAMGSDIMASIANRYRQLTTASQEFVASVKEGIGPLDDLWKKCKTVLDNIKIMFFKAIDNLKKRFQQLKTFISETFISSDKLISIGFLATLTVMYYKLGKMFKKVKKIVTKADILAAFKKIMSEVTNTLKVFQTSIKSNMLMTIAKALALLTASIVALSFIDAKKIAISLAALGAGLTELLAGVAILSKITGMKGYVKIPQIAISLILLSTAVLMLSSAVKKLSALSWEELLKGLVGVGVLLTSLSIQMFALSKIQNDIVKVGLSVLVLGLALRVLVKAVQQLGALDLASLAKGLGSVMILLTALGLFTRYSQIEKSTTKAGLSMALVGVSLVILAKGVKTISDMDTEAIIKGISVMGSLFTMLGLFSNFSNLEGLSKVGMSLLLISVAIKVMASALITLGSLDVATLTTGLLGIAGCLTALVTAMNFMPAGDLIKNALAMIAISAALVILAHALNKFGSMSIGELVVGLIALGGSLGIMIIAMKAMQTSVKGAMALFIVAAAIAVLAPAIKLLSSIPIAGAAIALGILGAALLMFTVALLALAPASAALLAIGGGVALLGAGVLMAGAGVIAFAAGLVALTAAAAGGAAAITVVGTAIIQLLPLLFEKLGEAISAFVSMIAEKAPEIATAMITILNELIRVIVEVGPNIIEALMTLIGSLLSSLATHLPQFVTFGMQMIVGILKGIADNIKDLIVQGANIVINFLKGIAEKLPEIIIAGMELILQFITGLSEGIEKYGAEIIIAANKLSFTFCKAVAKGMMGSAYMVYEAVAELFTGAKNKAEATLDINSPSKVFAKIGNNISEGAALGVKENAGLLYAEVTTMGDEAMEAMNQAMASVEDAFKDVNLEFAPTITPVLDMSEITSEASKLSDLFPDTQSINLSGSNIPAADLQELLKDNAQDSVSSGNINFTQNNYSPKALSSVDIYRQTNNQLSTMKEVAKDVAHSNSY